MTYMSHRIYLGRIIFAIPSNIKETGSRLSPYVHPAPDLQIILTIIIKKIINAVFEIVTK